MGVALVRCKCHLCLPRSRISHFLRASRAMAAADTVERAAPRPGDTLNQAWAKDTSAFGYRMLRKMGWNEGNGLGKNQDGINTHVKVSKRAQGLGLGAAKDTTGDSAWSSTASTFASVLSALNEVHGQDAQKGKQKKSKKKSKKSSSSSASSSSSSSSSPVPARKGLQPELKAACPSRARRVKAKDVRSFSTADLRAILGQGAASSHPPPFSAPAISSKGADIKEKQKKSKRKREEKDEDDGDSLAVKGKKEKKRKSKDKESRPLPSS
jgi:Pin2-interacting protein X1